LSVHQQENHVNGIVDGSVNGDGVKQQHHQMHGNGIVDDGSSMSMVVALSKGLSKVLMDGFVDGGGIVDAGGTVNGGGIVKGIDEWHC